VNNSLPRILDGLIATLRSEIIPALETDFARSQAIAAIDVLNNLKPRVDWLVTPLADEVAAQRALLAELSGVLAGSGAPAPPAVPDIAAAIPAHAVQATRDALDAHLCDLTRWLSAGRAALGPERTAAAEGLLSRHRLGEVRRQLGLTAQPLFSESSHAKSVEQSDNKSGPA
jgi:hypothetical protein